MGSPSFEPVQSGSSLLLAWQLKDRRVLIVGGGQVAAGRLQNVLEASALVTLIAPSSSLHPQVAYRIFEDPLSSPRITYHDRLFQGEEDLIDVDMVLTAIDDVETSREICRMSRELRIPVNVADVPPECDFYFGSQFRDGPLQVLVSTSGKGPKIANIIRRRIEDALPPNLGDTIEKVGKLRGMLRSRAPGVGGQLGKQRMDWMIEVCETWSLDELGELDEALCKKLLDEGWNQGYQVPSYHDLTGRAILRKSWNQSTASSSGHSINTAAAVVGGFAAGMVAAITLMRFMHLKGSAS
jgi:precorrin-2 dehydrogenase/sirohydrochlorin ferrochelatase